MITPARILNKYRDTEPYLESVRGQVRDALNVLCEANIGFALVSRIKTLDSVSEKIETGRFPAWGSIDDLVAFTVVVPTLADEATALAFLRNSFHQIELRERGGTKKAPDAFRFDCSRFIGRLKSPDPNLSSDIHNISFEVQIRSAFEHAWSVTTHSLTYKTPDIDWRRLRLAAQLKAAVEQLDTLILAFTDAKGYIKESDWPEVKAKSALKRYYDSLVKTGKIPEELTPKDWSRFVDNVYQLVRARPQRIEPDEIVRIVERDLNAELAGIGSAGVPRSISLWQLSFAALWNAGSIQSNLTRYWPLITPELEELYPGLKNFAPRFDYSK